VSALAGVDQREDLERELRDQLAAIVAAAELADVDQREGTSPRLGVGELEFELLVAPERRASASIARAPARLPLAHQGSIPGRLPP
jgi:hypothetical protein